MTKSTITNTTDTTTVNVPTTTLKVFNVSEMDSITSDRGCNSEVGKAVNEVFSEVIGLLKEKGNFIKMRDVVKTVRDRLAIDIGYNKVSVRCRNKVGSGRCKDMYLNKVNNVSLIVKK